MSKVVLVTGGSSGIGESVCKMLASSGYKVYGTSRNGQGETRHGFTLVKLDVEDQASVQECIQQIVNKEGKIDILINNAGVGIMGAVEDCSDEEIFKAFNINVFGLVRTTRAVLAHMRKQQSGLIINIASIAGHIGLPYRAYYSATKASVQRITEALRIEVEPFGIDACVVDPGDFNTNISGNRVVAQAVRKGSPYASETLRIEAMINSEINKSLNADMVGDLMLQIVQSKQPKAYYRIGKALQKLSVKVRSLVGAELFEGILKKHYKIK
jgi:short-subunit dehydrogenase